MRLVGGWMDFGGTHDQWQVLCTSPSLARAVSTSGAIGGNTSSDFTTKTRLHSTLVVGLDWDSVWYK